MSKSQLTSVFFILLCALSPIYGAFEYMQLVLTWPITFCRIKHCERTPTNFTIHGLWPDNHTTMLNYCDRSKPYNMFTDGKKKNDLDERWPDLTKTKFDSLDKQAFWKDEYVKHGTCCSDKFDREQYFDLAMTLRDKFDLLSSLRNHGISRGFSYTVQNLNNTIKAITGGFPNLTCSRLRELKEIGICFDETVKNVIDCPNPKTCKPTNKGVMFP
uniref:Ribonuclease S-2 n=1 Tax=Nicotiana alata TaxID=4087 RepID=RNS2_NICAL|nr:RecName: Full=Ribonuclease S-2; AltName: Full=S2-RNase; AltName: Full=Stylar glycoprotein 2; Flags: Precursor [Nicotiana alata]AAA34083.1 stylar glycoprotein S2 precursor [Nicotiana alata]AAB40027.1 S2-RNase [Nicotiana alata]CAA27428.1 unnamed protein product [Nicotiana alata]prf//1205301A glycoprotein S2,stylar [Nicotiana alata]